jgi:hypothetical protein
MHPASLLITIFYLSFAFATENNNRQIEDTMITNDYISLYKVPDNRDKKNKLVKLKPNCIVIAIDKKLIPNTLGPKVVEYYIKVKTLEGNSGYIWIDALISKKQFNQHQDSLKLWVTLPQPSYKNLIGTTYFKNDELPAELSSGEFVSIGEKNLYGIISLSNKYNGNYSYLFFVIEDKTKGDGLKILDIIPLNPAAFKKGSSLWFKQCKCPNKSVDCSDVVAIYFHNDSMATKNILVKPDKAWRPNYTTKRLEAIPPESVKCGSMASEEGDAEGP